jgi:hypothetical protein
VGHLSQKARELTLIDPSPAEFAPIRADLARLYIARSLS